MPRFRYKAVTPTGEIVEGALEAPSRSAVIERLRGQGHMPIRADAQAEPDRARWWQKPIRLSRGLTRGDIILITRQLATLLQAGLPPHPALGLIAPLEADGPRQALVSEVLEAARGGTPLAHAPA